MEHRLERFRHVQGWSEIFSNHRSTKANSTKRDRWAESVNNEQSRGPIGLWYAPGPETGPWTKETASPFPFLLGETLLPIVWQGFHPLRASSCRENLRKICQDNKHNLGNYVIRNRLRDTRIRIFIRLIEKMALEQSFNSS